MSRSSVTGQDAQEASNGVDTSDTPKASNLSGVHGFATQGLKSREGTDFEPHEGSPALSETLKHTLQSHTDHSESLVQHNQCAHIPTEHEDTHSCETELINGRSKKELEEWRGEEDERKTSDGEANSVNKGEVKQKKESFMCVQVRGWIKDVRWYSFNEILMYNVIKTKY